MHALRAAFHRARARGHPLGGRGNARRAQAAARRSEAVPALILASYRDDVLGQAQPLRIVIGELVTSSATRRLSLAPLSREAVASMAEPYLVDRSSCTNGPAVTVLRHRVLAAASETIPPTVRDAVLARPSG